MEQEVCFFFSRPDDQMIERIDYREKNQAMADFVYNRPATEREVSKIPGVKVNPKQPPTASHQRIFYTFLHSLVPLSAKNVVTCILDVQFWIERFATVV